MRTALTVIGVIVLLVMLVCISRGVVVLRFWDGELQWSVRYLGIRILPRKKKKGAPKKSKKKAAPPAEAEEEKKDFLMDKLWKLLMDIAGKADMASSALYALPGPLVLLLKNMRWYELETDFVIGGEDAAEAAQLYGRLQAVLHLILGGASSLMTVRPKRLSMVCDYTEDTSRWNFGCRISVSVGAVIVAGIWFVWDFFKDGRVVGKNLVRDKL